MRHIVRSVEERAVGPVIDHISHEFESEDGLLFVDVQAVIETFLLRGEKIGVRLENLSIEPADGERKRVQAWLSFVRKTAIEPDRSLPPGAVIYAFDLIFEHREGRWQALSGSYERQ
ncbi:MAG: hypothetical protein GY725_02395 [bacterium]|nr:hypothetical protein [bacterium]